MSKHQAGIGRAVINADDHKAQRTNAVMRPNFCPNWHRPTGGCVGKQNRDNEQFLFASIQFSISFHQRAQKKTIARQFQITRR